MLSNLELFKILRIRYRSYFDMKNARFIVLIHISCYITYILCDEINLSNVKIYGPGLNPDKIVMPARYFYVDTGLEYDIIKLHLPIFEIVTHGTNTYNINCRVWSNILDRKDGSFIIRYKLYETCYNFKIEIIHESQHLGGSPYIFQKPVLADDCNCPENDLKAWLEDYGCRQSYMQIEKDLIPFSTINFTDLRPKILTLYNKPTSHSICNYIVKDNKIYRKCYGKYVGFNMFMDSILLSLTRKTKLPNLELFVNLGDWPLAPKNKKALPIFSWCGSDDTYDVVMPTYDVTESTLENMGRVMLDMLSVQGNIKFPWDSKIPKIFWRGRDANQRRLDLIDISRKHPDLFNVSLTNFFFFRNEMEKYGPKSEHVSFFSFFDYKYQLNIDGTVAAYRFPYLLVGDSVVFKQDSKYYEWFYKSLKAGVHFIQVNDDLSNLVERVNWAVQNDSEARKIAENGQRFARDHLMPQDVICYYATLLTKWSDRIVSPVEILDEMEKVNQPEAKSPCDCGQQAKDEL